MKTTKINKAAIEMQNMQMIRDNYKNIATAWLKTDKPYMQITAVGSRYSVKLFGKQLGTVNGEENVKMVEEFIKNALIISGVILP